MDETAAQFVEFGSMADLAVTAVAEELFYQFKSD
jgi:hypothetical protein